LLINYVFTNPVLNDAIKVEEDGDQETNIMSQHLAIGKLKLFK
jgi:hypothetical protein